MSEGAKLQGKRLKSKGTVYNRATMSMSDLTKLKKSKSIVLLDIIKKINLSPEI